MTGAAGRPDVAAAAGLGQLGAEAERARTSYGEGALIMCDRLVRIYAAEGIEVQALQGLDLLIADGRADRDRGGVRQREVHADEHPGRAGHPDGGPGPGGRA